MACDAWAWRSQWIDAAGLTPARLAASLMMKRTARSVSGKPCGRQIPISLLVAIGAIGKKPERHSERAG
jgi:hypothetical protein